MKFFQSSSNNFLYSSLAAYMELNVIECARDGKNSQTQLCIDKNIKGFPSWEINGKIILGVQTLKELSKLSGYMNLWSNEILNF